MRLLFVLFFKYIVKKLDLLINSVIAKYYAITVQPGKVALDHTKDFFNYTDVGLLYNVIGI